MTAPKKEAVPTTDRSVADEFDLDALKVPTGALSGHIQVEAHPIALAVRKPKKDEFIRVNTDPDYRMPCILIQGGERDDKPYIVTGALLGHEIVSEQGRVINLLLAVNRQGREFLWPLVNSQETGRSPMEWHTSAEEAAGYAETVWTKIVAGENQYEIYTAKNSDLSDPIWAKGTFSDRIKLAFKNRIICDPEHDVIQRLEGNI